MTTTTYSVTYRGSIETEIPADLPGEATLDEVRETCKSLGLEADLHDAAGFRKGQVHADGSYKLQ